MEQVLDLYTSVHSEDEPMICMDEAAYELKGDTVEPIAMEPGSDTKEDYHYERNGVRSLLIFFDPNRGWRRVSSREHRTRIDWAEEVRQLLEEDYPHAGKVKLVCDNLNTHHVASLYEAFPAAEAHQLASRLEIHHTPRRGSWLNIAEIELSVLAQQCLERRIATADELERQLKAWQDARNQERCQVIWRFTTADARIKLHRLYPSVNQGLESAEPNAPN